MSGRVGVFVLILLLAFALGCGTFGTLIPGTAHSGPDTFGIYSGVRRDWVMTGHDGLWALDLPFSLVLDTILLPVSIVVTLARGAYARTGTLRNRRATSSTLPPLRHDEDDYPGPRDLLADNRLDATLLSSGYPSGTSQTCISQMPCRTQEAMFCVPIQRV